MYWSNGATQYLKYKAGDIIMIWDEEVGIKKAMEIYKDNPKVFALSDRYYLDCGRGNKYGDRSWCDPYKTWWKIYSFEPTKHTNDSTVLGGEVLAWSEMID